MTTTTIFNRNGNLFDNGKDSEKATLTSSSQPTQEWFNAQVLPGLPLHLELILMGAWETEGMDN